MIRNLSRKPLIKLTQLFNHILRFGYFPSAPILKPGKPLSDPGSHRPVSLLRNISNLLGRVVTTDCTLLFIRITFYLQNNLTPANKFQQSLDFSESPTSSLMALILENKQTLSYVLLR